jgi:hypothetical protein
VRPRRLVGASGRPLNFTVRQRDMSAIDWVSVGEYADAYSAGIVSKRLTTEEVPHRIVTSGLPRGGPIRWIWVPPEWVDKAKEVLSHDAVPDDELTKLALNYPPPDDAGA